MNASADADLVTVQTAIGLDERARFRPHLHEPRSGGGIVIETLAHALVRRGHVEDDEPIRIAAFPPIERIQTTQPRRQPVPVCEQRSSGGNAHSASRPSRDVSLSPALRAGSSRSPCASTYRR